MHMPIVLAFAFNEFGLLQFLLLAMIGVLIFGKRLPEVGKNLGRSIVEFKKGMASAGEPLSTDAGQSPVVTSAQPAALPPGQAEEQNRKQQDEIKRLSDEVRALKEQMAQKSSTGNSTPSA